MYTCQNCYRSYSTASEWSQGSAFYYFVLHTILLSRSTKINITKSMLTSAGISLICTLKILKAKFGVSSALKFIVR